MQEYKIGADTLKDGDTVYHLSLRQPLRVVADEKGPAFTGREYEDDEISLSYANAEMHRGNLMKLAAFRLAPAKPEPSGSCPTNSEGWEGGSVFNMTEGAI